MSYLHREYYIFISILDSVSDCVTDSFVLKQFPKLADTVVSLLYISKYEICWSISSDFCSIVCLKKYTLCVRDFPTRKLYYFSSSYSCFLDSLQIYLPSYYILTYFSFCMLIKCKLLFGDILAVIHFICVNFVTFYLIPC